MWNTKINLLFKPNENKSDLKEKKICIKTTNLNQNEREMRNCHFYLSKILVVTI